MPTGGVKIKMTQHPSDDEKKNEEYRFPPMMDYWSGQSTVLWIGITNMAVFFTIICFLDGTIHLRNISDWKLLFIVLILLGIKFIAIFVSFFAVMRGSTIRKNMLFILLYWSAIWLSAQYKIQPFFGFACCSGVFMLVTAILLAVNGCSFIAKMEKRYPDIMREYRLYDGAYDDREFFLECKLAEIIEEGRDLEVCEAIKRKNEVGSILFWNFQTMVFTLFFMVSKGWFY